MAVLIETATGRILEVADQEFPVHPNWQWHDLPLGRADIGDFWDGTAIKKRQRTAPARPQDPRDAALAAVQQELADLKANLKAGKPII